MRRGESQGVFNLPVGGLVLSGLARGAAGLDQIGIADAHAKVATAMDGVGVAGDDAIVDDGVDTGETGAATAGHTPEGVGGAGEGEEGKGIGGLDHDGDTEMEVGRSKSKG